MKNPFKRKGGNVRYIVASRTGDTPDTEIDERIRKLENTAGSLKPPFNRIEHLDKKRAVIALIFVCGYIGLVLLATIWIPLYNKWVGHAQPIDLDKTFSQLGALLGTPLGFVVGYYFKENKRK
jgi:hypothetical protein